MFPGMFGPIGLFQQAPWMDPAAYMAAAPHWDYLLRFVSCITKLILLKINNYYS